MAAALALRGRVVGPALALGIGAYTSYMFVQYILGPDYGDLPGNNERLFPLCLLLFATGWMVALAAWQSPDLERVASSRRRERTIGRFVLPILGFLAFFRYVPSLADWMSPTPEDEGYLAGPSFAWAIAMLDLGVFLPATVVTCVGLIRGRLWAQKALYLVVGWFGLVGLAVAAMAIAMYVNDDPQRRRREHHLHGGPRWRLRRARAVGLSSTLPAAASRRDAGQMRKDVMRAAADVLRAAPLFVTSPLFRRRHLRWGATEAELRERMPGDELLADPSFNATRAITIDTPPDKVWPGLVQIGYGRAGFYSYDLFDNAARPSAERIIPEFQSPEVGDWVPMASKVTPGTAFKIAAFEPARSFLWQKPESTWGWTLKPLPGGRTRLITRLKARYEWSSPLSALLSVVLLEFADFLMMRKMLRGLKTRAEAR